MILIVTLLTWCFGYFRLYKPSIESLGPESIVYTRERVSDRLLTIPQRTPESLFYFVQVLFTTDKIDI